MSDTPASIRPTSSTSGPASHGDRRGLMAEIKAHLIPTAITFGIVGLALWNYLDELIAYLVLIGIRPNLPDLAELAAVPPLIAVHAGSASLALVLGAIVLWGQKGTARHKLLGRIWVGVMVLTAGSSAFITSFQPVIGPFGFIHLFTVWTAVTLPMAIMRARRGDIVGHRNMMTGLYIGLWIAGLFTFLPGRTLFGLFLG